MNVENSSSGLHAIRLVGALGLLALVSACAETPPASSTTAAPSSTTGTATAAPSTGKVNLSKCATPAQNRVFFRLGDTTLAPSGAAIVDAIPSNMKPPLQQEAVRQELQAQAARGGGCPEKPIDAVLLMLKQDLGHPLLDGTVGIVRSPGTPVTKRFAELTRQLQQKPTGNCKALGGDLLGCVGTETRGDRQTPVLYVITTDRTKTLTTGGPLAARCILEGEKIKGCNIMDQISPNVTFDASLNAGDYSTAGLSGAHSAAVATIKGLRR